LRMPGHTGLVVRAGSCGLGRRLSGSTWLCGPSHTGCVTQVGSRGPGRLGWVTWVGSRGLDHRTGLTYWVPRAGLVNSVALLGQARWVTWASSRGLGRPTRWPYKIGRAGSRGPARVGWVTPTGLRDLGCRTRSRRLGRWTLRPYLVVQAMSPDWVMQTRSPYWVARAGPGYTGEVAEHGCAG
jgi:hypothetical protein